MRFQFILALSFIFFLSAQAQAQAGKSWQSLSRVTYKKVYDEMLGLKIDVPVFSAEVRNLEGKELTLRGYIVPTNGYVSATEFVLSAYPINMCFFCGGAGPESVMEVHAKDPIKFSNEPVTLRGVLELNENDPNRLIYSIHNARRIAE